MGAVGQRVAARDWLLLTPKSRRLIDGDRGLDVKRVGRENLPVALGA